MPVKLLHSLVASALLGAPAAWASGVSIGPLAVEPLFFAEDTCLAPSFAGRGCPSPAATDAGLSASAALLPVDLPEAAPTLAFDAAVLVEGEELSHMCRAPECPRPQRIVG